MDNWLRLSFEALLSSLSKLCTAKFTRLRHGAAFFAGTPGTAHLCGGEISLSVFQGSWSIPRWRPSATAIRYGWPLTQTRLRPGSGIIFHMTKCPVCQAGDAIEGRLLPSADDSSTACFYPNGLRLMAFTRSVPLEQGQQFNACLHRGHVWSRLPADKLRKLMERSGKPKLKV